MVIAPGALDVLRSLNSQLAGGSQLCLEKALACNQHALSVWMLLVGKSSLPGGPPFWSETGPGARAFLVAVPSGPTRMEKVTFVAELRVRLGVPDAPPMSGAPLR